MAQKLKNHVCRRLLNHLVLDGPSPTDFVKLASKIELRKTGSKVGLGVPADFLSTHNEIDCVQVKCGLKTDHIIDSVSITSHLGKPNLFLQLNEENFVREVFASSPAAKPHPSCGKRVIVEFSSPNIAKPIHVGHLRSTIIGNFISNLHEWFGYDVVRLNYLGDWGPQFGLVKVGMKMLNPTSEELSQKPLHTLYQAYVTASAAAKEDSQISDEARNIFLNLESGKIDDISDWELYKKYTIDELRKTYSRLGIKFDKYSCESDYKVDSISHILQLLERSGHMTTDGEKRSVFSVDGQNVPVLKSDGTGLYLTRDIAAAIDRMNEYKFDKMYYLADTSQHRHFRNLFHILGSLNLPWSKNLEHIYFGRVRGMSTRSGEVVFLHDILNEAHELMVKQQKASKNTRVDIEEDVETSDVLGVSTIVIADLKHKRKRDYTFDWTAERSLKGNTGVRLQYTHCRLKSLYDRNFLLSAPVRDSSYLSEPDAVNLLFEIARFEEVLQASFDKLEASQLSDYLFTLCDSINKAFLTLRVLNAGKVGEQRLLLFEEARTVLHQGMTLLGITPLNRM